MLFQVLRVDDSVQPRLSGFGGVGFRTSGLWGARFWESTAARIATAAADSFISC